MLDIKMIRQNINTVKEKLANRGVDSETLEQFITLDERRRELLVQVEEKKKLRNTVSEEISQLKRNKEDAQTKITEMKEVGSLIKALDGEISQIDTDITYIADRLPNIPHESVPVGADEEDNVEVRQWGTPKTFEFEAKAHWTLLMI